MKISKETLKGNTEIIILQVLQGRAFYGYELVQAIKKESEDIFDFKEGTVYPLLYRMEEKGYVTSKKKHAPSGKTRRYYFITKKGQEMLANKKLEIKELYLGLEKMQITK